MQMPRVFPYFGEKRKHNHVICYAGQHHRDKAAEEKSQPKEPNLRTQHTRLSMIPRSTITTRMRREGLISSRWRHRCLTTDDWGPEFKLITSPCYHHSTSAEQWGPRPLSSLKRQKEGEGVCDLAKEEVDQRAGLAPRVSREGEGRKKTLHETFFLLILNIAYKLKRPVFHWNCSSLKSVILV